MLNIFIPIFALMNPETVAMQSFIQTLLNSSIRFKMIKVEGGVFEMGGKSSLPVHKVQLRDFWIGELPVTQELWEAVMGKGKNESNFKGKRRPVENVSWVKISEEFLPALNRFTESMRPVGTIYSLPTEAQWEYAARGGKLSKGFEYAGSYKLDDVGLYDKNSHMETKPVGLKLPNELVLYDMSGNVWEWCCDWYDSYYYEFCKVRGIALDPSGPKDGKDRILRGGSWANYAQYCQLPHRNFDLPASCNDYFGFRLVLVPKPAHESPVCFQ